MQARPAPQNKKDPGEVPLLSVKRLQIHASLQRIPATTSSGPQTSKCLVDSAGLTPIVGARTGPRNCPPKIEKEISHEPDNQLLPV